MIRDRLLLLHYSRPCLRAIKDFSVANFGPMMV